MVFSKIVYTDKGNVVLILIRQIEEQACMTMESRYICKMIYNSTIKHNQNV